MPVVDNDITTNNYEDTVQNRFKGMSPKKKLELFLQLYYSTRELKEAALKIKHPDWSEEAIEKELKKIFLYART